MEVTIKNSEFQFGIEDLDKSHKIFVERVKELEEIISTNQEEDRLYIFLCLMERYIEKHLHDEEKIFSSLDYHEKMEHKIEHMNLKSKVSDTMARHFKRQKGLDKELYVYLGIWFEQHILKRDRDLAKILKEL